jgi:Tol biopolymer transport system component
VAGQFSFAPDMSELIQEDMTGRFLSNMLFYRKGDTSTQIISNFTRAMYPDWSPHKREISFWGTESYPGGSPHNFTTLPEILGLNSYPWDLYISTPEGTNLIKVLSSVEDPGSIKWSPKENVIAFSGTIDGNPGVFLIDPETPKVKRFWSKAGDFDWSPDGSKMVIVDAKKENDGTIIEQNINIISLE